MKSWRYWWGIAACLLALGGQAAEDDVSVSQPHNAIPPNMVASSAKPMVMLAASKDHTLFGPIYNDYEDVDDDGIIDVTYKPSYKYYGYFDSSKCYLYSSANGRFEPDSFAQIKADKSYKCSEQKRLWSGNFLNWATTSRLDVVRKMLYGGKRYLDGVSNGTTASVTVLEAAYLSSDAHSFVKHYAGTDIRDFTPFSVADLTLANKYGGLTICNRGRDLTETGVPTILMVKGNYRMWGTIEGVVCAVANASFGPKLLRYYIDPDKGAGKVPHELYLPNNLAQAADYGVGYELIMRVRVCVPDFIGEERCQAFPANSSKNFKPYGIFQEFALGVNYPSNARVEFGVITGSYDRNITGGALRKNMGDFQDEINLNTGVFCHSASSGCAATLADGRPTGKGAIKAFDSILLLGRGGVPDYTGSNGQLPSGMYDGLLPAWGNPLGEMIVQSLNYYAGLTSLNPTPPQTIDNSKGLFAPAWKDPFTLGDAARRMAYGEAACRPLYNLALSSSASNFDYGGEDWFKNLPNREQNLIGYTNKVGDAEGIHGTQRSVGSVQLNSGGTFGEHCGKKTVNALADVSGICPEAPGTAGTYHVAGAALYANTRKIRNLENPPADLNRIKDALRVKMLSASLAGGVARIEIPIPNSNPRRYVYITPESLWNLSGRRMPGGMLTFESISSSATHGAFVVTWNDALFGGDYDMDIAGFIRYDIVNNPAGGYNIEIKTDIINVSAGAVGTHGFSIIGVEPVEGSTEGDGRYLTHRTRGSYSQVSSSVYAIDNPLIGAVGYECQGNTADDYVGGRCSVATGASSVWDKDFPVVKRFKMVGVSNVTLKEPLWYAAKYGGFDSNVLNADGTYGVVSMPANTASWDKVKTDGTPGADGIPDNYFLARRPEILEAQLRRALEVVVSGAYSAPAVSSPVALQEGEYKYEATFDSERMFGELKAFKLKASGEFPSASVWEAGQLLHTQHAATGGNGRVIITNDGGVGIPFRWASMSAAYRAQLTTASKNKLSVANAQIAVDYIRGAQTHESSKGLRVRESNLLGPIVNAAPWLQTAPRANRAGDAYRTFFEAHKNRASVLWVAANDGMLHAFNYATGGELMAFVPGVLANRLAEIPLQRGQSTETTVNGSNFVTGSLVMPQGKVWAYVDGSPFTGDVMVGSQWHTYLFGTLGRGGKAVYALNVTSLSNFKESTASDVFKWQFTAKDDEDLGYIISKIQVHSSTNQPTPIVKLNDGKYAIILGNGHGSTHGRAALFILYADGPSAGSWTGRYRKIVLDATTPGNGLSAPQWEDIDGNGTADVVYAGDLNGAVWKVDLSSSDPAQWKSAYTQTDAAGNVQPTPFFRARATQGGTSVGLPITTQPTLLYMGQGGFLVNFVTGNAFSSADFPAMNVQNAIFGVWDRGSPIALNAALQLRTLQRDGNGDLWLASSTADEQTWKYQGWRATLPASGEAGLSSPFYTAGVLTLVTTRPMAGQNVCIDSPRTSLLALDPISGRPERDVLGTLLVDGVTMNRAGKDISDAELLAMTDRRPPAKKACTAGEPGCICTGTECSKNVQACPAGYQAKAILGSKTDEALCYSTRPRMHWREITEVRTYP